MGTKSIVLRLDEAFLEGSKTEGKFNNPGELKSLSCTGGEIGRPQNGHRPRSSFCGLIPDFSELSQNKPRENASRIIPLRPAVRAIVLLKGKHEATHRCSLSLSPG